MIMKPAAAVKKKRKPYKRRSGARGIDAIYRQKATYRPKAERVAQGVSIIKGVQVRRVPRAEGKANRAAVNSGRSLSVAATKILKKSIMEHPQSMFAMKAHECLTHGSGGLNVRVSCVRRHRAHRGTKRGASLIA